MEARPWDHFETDASTVCVKDYGLHNQKYRYNKFFECFISNLDSSLVEIKKKIKAQIWLELHQNQHKQAHASVFA